MLLGRQNRPLVSLIFAIAFSTSFGSKPNSLAWRFCRAKRWSH
jgi:hypothetical protein